MSLLEEDSTKFWNISVGTFVIHKTTVTTHLCTKCYIGLTSRTIETRWSKHNNNFRKRSRKSGKRKISHKDDNFIKMISDQAFFITSIS